MLRAMCLLVLMVVMTGCGKEPEAVVVKAKGGPAAAAGGLAHDGYVWQRKWSEGVSKSVAAAPGNGIGEVVILALEIRADGRGVRGVEVTKVEPDWGVLKALPGGVGLGVRIHPYAGPFEGGGEVMERVIGEVKGMLARAEREGVKVREVQIDFDAAQGKLEGYRVWVEAMKGALAGVRVEVTVLPAWMEEAAFLPLVKACDAYVLQVHGLAFDGAGEGVICDLEKARKWIAQARGLGVPFRVALPTYGYMVAYDAAGKRVGIEAEAGYRGKVEGVARRTELTSDPTAMAGLVKELSTQKDAVLRGVIWYRLPVEGDYRNWRWETLKEVMGGRAPVPILKVGLVAAEGGDGVLFDVVLGNEGNADAGLSGVKVVFDGAERIATADGVAGFGVGTVQGTGRLVFHRLVSGEAKVRPGERKVIGWVRFKPEASKEAVPYVEWKR
jgi:hypothetical protein